MSTRTKLFWVAVLYSTQGFPFGVFYELFPVYFRQLGIELKDIGQISLLGLAWTLKYLWAPAVDHYRHHRVWMAVADVAMATVLVAFAASKGFGAWMWVAIGAFTVLSATNDIAIDGYTIELLHRDELGLANGIRIGFWRVGVLASGLALIVSDWIAWPGAFACGALTLAICMIGVLAAPRERAALQTQESTLQVELRRILRDPNSLALVAAVALGTLWLINNVTRWSEGRPGFWIVAWGVAAAVIATAWIARSALEPESIKVSVDAERGPMLGALFELFARPHIVPVLAFVLIFKLGDASMGFMVKPFWVDAKFSATEIGLVSVNIGLVLSIAGGIAGGWYAHRAGIFKALWVLGLFQAFSNLGYVFAAWLIPYGPQASPDLWHRAVLYSASAAESFTGGLGTAAFLAFLMAIVDKRHSATEYALLSSVFALSRSLAGWASGFGAQELGYARYFLLTFFLSFPAYTLLPWVRRMLEYVDMRNSSAGPSA
jgi:PAT family beta-lactamase induction signal transducer AmpG